MPHLLEKEHLKHEAQYRQSPLAGKVWLVGLPCLTKSGMVEVMQRTDCTSTWGSNGPVQTVAEALGFKQVSLHAESYCNSPFCPTAETVISKVS